MDKIKNKNIIISFIAVLTATVIAVVLNRLMAGVYCIAVGTVIMLFAWFVPEIKVNRAIVKEILLVINGAVAFFLLESVLENFGGVSPLASLYNILIIYVFEKLIEFILGNSKLAMVLVIFIAFGIGAAEFYVLRFRGSPITPWDLKVLDTAATVFSQYTFTYPKQVYLPLMGCIGITVLIMKLQLPKAKRWKNRLQNGLIVIVGVALLYGGVYPRLENAMWEMELLYSRQGMVASFVANLKYMQDTAPEGYDEQAVVQLLEEIDSRAAISSVQAQNVIVIMNESFSDFRVINDEMESNEYMPIWDSLSENTLKGFVHVPVKGGGTCDSEFEALTGLTTRYVGAYPYVLKMQYEMESMARFFKQYDFETIGYHPFYGKNWNRIWSYGMMGFDSFLSLESDWSLEKLRFYATDESNYKKVIQLNEASEGDKFFMFNITIQNHGDYKDEGGDVIKTVDLSEYGNLPFTETYLSLMEISDQAIGDLLTHYQAVEEPTLICIFGDHQPSIENEYYEIMYGKSASDLTAEERLAYYKTPVMIWANYDIPDGQLGEFSLNYLAPVIMQYAGYDLNSLYSYLLELKEEYPVISRNGIIDNTGRLLSAEEESSSQKLREYENLCYYLLKGGVIE